MAERFDRLLAGRLAAESDVLERQFILLDWYFAQYDRHLPDRVVTYERIVQTGGRALSIICKEAESLDEPLSSRNTLALKHDSQARSIADDLLSRESACWRFYQRDEVEALFT
jgi:hypothetical protein